MQACYSLLPSFIQRSFFEHCLLFGPPLPDPSAAAAAAVNEGIVADAQRQLQQQFSEEGGAAEHAGDDGEEGGAGGVASGVRKRFRGSGQSGLPFSKQFALMGPAGLVGTSAIIPPDGLRAQQIARMSQEAEQSKRSQAFLQSGQGAGGQLGAQEVRMREGGSLPLQGGQHSAAGEQQEQLQPQQEQLHHQQLGPNLLHMLLRRLMTVTSSSKDIISPCVRAPFFSMGLTFQPGKGKGRQASIEFRTASSLYTLTVQSASQVCVCEPSRKQHGGAKVAIAGSHEVCLSSVLGTAWCFM